MAVDDSIIPQDQQIIDPGYSYKELHEEPIRNIAEGKQTVPEKETETPQPDKKDEEIPLETIVDRTAQATAQKLLDEERARRDKAEADRKAEEEKNKPQPKPNQEYQKIVDEFKEKEGRTPTWDELAAKIEERSITKLEERQAERQRLADEAATKVRTEREEEQKRLDAHVDDELGELYNANKLTRIEDPTNPSDPGVMERKDFFNQWFEVNRKRVAEGKPEIISATRIYDFYYKKPNVQPPGADAPIAGNRTSTVSPQDEMSYSYTDIRKPWSFFRRMR